MKSYKKRNFRARRRNYKSKRRLKKRRSILKSRLFLGFLLGLILVCSTFYLLFFSKVFKIQEIRVIAPSGTPHIEIRTLLEKELQKKSLWVLPKASLFLAQCRKAEDKILKEYPEVKEVNLKRRFPRSLILEIKKREAIGILCYFTKDPCFLIDKESIIFKEIKRENKQEGLITIFSEQEGSRKLGEQVFPEEKMNQILEIHNELKGNLGLNGQSFTIGKGGLLTVKTAQGWEIYFNLESDIRLALTKLILLLEKELPPDKRKNLQYIDLRFTKVYYK